jgi:DnaJ-class molecular chaperone
MPYVMLFPGAIDYYKTLGVPNNASAADIKKAFFSVLS